MKTLVSIPCMDMVHTMFLASLLQLKPVGEVEFSLTQSSLIYDARNALASKAVTEGFDRIMWLDSDITFEPDLMIRLSNRLDEGFEFVSGLYFSRKPPINPVAYSDVGIRGSVPFCDPYIGYPDKIFEVAGVGMGGCMMTVDLVKGILDNYGLPFSPIVGFGEDLSFCNRVRDYGKKIYCDPTIKLGHVGMKIYQESDFIREE